MLLFFNETFTFSLWCPINKVSSNVYPFKICRLTRFILAGHSSRTNMPHQFLHRLNSFRFWIFSSDSYYPRHNRHSHAVSVSISEVRLGVLFQWTTQVLRQVFLAFRVPAFRLHLAGNGVCRTQVGQPLSSIPSHFKMNQRHRIEARIFMILYTLYIYVFW